MLRQDDIRIVVFKERLRQRRQIREQDKGSQD